MATIYMPLLNEGTDVWRPVEATPLTGNSFRVEGDVPDYEQWAFAPGAVVLCAWKTFNGGGAGWAAIGLAE
jgi:hypothetical protein